MWSEVGGSRGLFQSGPRWSSLFNSWRSDKEERRCPSPRKQLSQNEFSGFINVNNNTSWTSAIERVGAKHPTSGRTLRGFYSRFDFSRESGGCDLVSPSRCRHLRGMWRDRAGFVSVSAPVSVIVSRLSDFEKGKTERRGSEEEEEEGGKGEKNPPVSYSYIKYQNPHC